MFSPSRRGGREAEESSAGVRWNDKVLVRGVRVAARGFVGDGGPWAGKAGGALKRKVGGADPPIEDEIGGVAVDRGEIQRRRGGDGDRNFAAALADFGREVRAEFEGEGAVAGVAILNEVDFDVACAGRAAGFEDDFGVEWDVVDAGFGGAILRGDANADRVLVLGATDVTNYGVRGGRGNFVVIVFETDPGALNLLPEHGGTGQQKPNVTDAFHVKIMRERRDAAESALV
jgi:hypothetical protein